MLTTDTVYSANLIGAISEWEIFCYVHTYNQSFPLAT